MNERLSYKTRKLLCASAAKPVSDGKPGSHSPFMYQLLEAFRTTGRKVGHLTFVDLVQNVQFLNPPPLAGDFGSEPGADFYFVSTKPVLPIATALSQTQRQTTPASRAAIRPSSPLLLPLIREKASPSTAGSRGKRKMPPTKAGPADALYRSALDDCHAELWDSAIEKLKRAATTDPTNPLIYDALGCSYLHLAKANEAITCLTRAIQLPKGATSQALRRLAYAYMDKWQWEKAAKYCDDALKVNPKDGYALLYRAYIVEKRQDYDEAIRLYQEMLASGITLSGETYFRLALTKKKLAAKYPDWENDMKVASTFGFSSDNGKDDGSQDPRPH